MDMIAPAHCYVYVRSQPADLPLPFSFTESFDLADQTWYLGPSPITPVGPDYSMVLSSAKAGSAVNGDDGWSCDSAGWYYDGSGFPVLEIQSHGEGGGFNSLGQSLVLRSDGMPNALVHHVQCDLSYYGSRGSNGEGVVWGYQDANNYWFAQPNSDSGLGEIASVVSGVKTHIAALNCDSWVSITVDHNFVTGALTVDTYEPFLGATTHYAGTHSWSVTNGKVGFLGGHQNGGSFWTAALVVGFSLTYPRSGLSGLSNVVRDSQRWAFVRLSGSGGNATVDFGGDFTATFTPTTFGGYPDPILNGTHLVDDQGYGVGGSSSGPGPTLHNYAVGGVFATTITPGQLRVGAVYDDGSSGGGIYGGPDSWGFVPWGWSGSTTISVNDGHILKAGPVDVSLPDWIADGNAGWAIRSGALRPVWLPDGTYSQIFRDGTTPFGKLEVTFDSSDIGNLTLMMAVQTDSYGNYPTHALEVTPGYVGQLISSGYHPVATFTAPSFSAGDKFSVDVIPTYDTDGNPNVLSIALAKNGTVYQTIYPVDATLDSSWPYATSTYVGLQATTGNPFDEHGNEIGGLPVGVRDITWTATNPDDPSLLSSPGVFRLYPGYSTPTPGFAWGAMVPYTGTGSFQRLLGVQQGVRVGAEVTDPFGVLYSTHDRDAQVTELSVVDPPIAGAVVAYQVAFNKHGPKTDYDDYLLELWFQPVPPPSLGLTHGGVIFE